MKSNWQKESSKLNGCVRDSSENPHPPRRMGLKRIARPDILTLWAGRGARPHTIFLNLFFIVFTISTFFCSVTTIAQYAPQAGLAGSEAMYKDSLALIDWANRCSIKRGWLDIVDTTLGKAIVGDSSHAFAKADGNVVSLGDGGEAIYFFDNPIVDGAGYDFAIFENGFRDPLDSSMAYLELAKISVSNDGINYYEFQATCHNDSNVQIAGVGDYMDARKLNNLAGKYIGNYGTPFDLFELSSILSLDVNNIRYVKVKDVIGSINKNYCTHDMHNSCINDPYPTPFPSSGFDLDALGVIHHKFPTELILWGQEREIGFYPNPTSGVLMLKHKSSVAKVLVYSLAGKQVLKKQEMNLHLIDISTLANSHYILSAFLENGERINQLISKNE